MSATQLPPLVHVAIAKLRTVLVAYELPDFASATSSRDLYVGASEAARHLVLAADRVRRADPKTSARVGVAAEAARLVMTAIDESNDRPEIAEQMASVALHLLAWPEAHALIEATFVWTRSTFGAELRRSAARALFVASNVMRSALGSLPIDPPPPPVDACRHTPACVEGHLCAGRVEALSTAHRSL